MGIIRILLVFVFTFMLIGHSSARVIKVGESRTISVIGNQVEILEDPSGKLSVDQVLNSPNFKLSTSDVPNFGITKSTYWLRFELLNETINNFVFLTLQYPLIDNVELYTIDTNGSVSVTVTGEKQSISERKIPNQNFVFQLFNPKGTTKKYLLKVSSEEQILIPLYIGSSAATFQAFNNQDILTGIYFGIIAVMVFYNFFVYLSVRDRSYLYYVFFIVFIGLTQIALQGYSYRFFWPSYPSIANHSVIFFPAIVGILAIEFFKNFLQIKNYSKYFIYILNLLNVFYIVNCVLSVSGHHRLSQQLLQPNAMLASFIIVGISVYAIRRKNRSAIFFLAAWLIFLVGIIIFILKDIGKLPYNNFTNYILNIGSAIEVIVLSFALADKINIFRKEKEESQANELRVVQENEKLVREQNVVLEQKVNERTHELKLTNQNLETALTDLKEAETQLVESEKMASLGQLTAGIAHEINNPINFVTSNVKPLNRDVLILIDTITQLEKIALDDVSSAEKQKQIEEYKTDIDYDYLKVEIDQLLSGIGEGASRTAEIVKGLRIFSRLDEDDLKKADINEGLESTLIITNNLLNNVIKIEKHYASLPLIECYPGKLNQVFLNIISNGVYAVRKKFGDADGGIISITTKYDEKYIYIIIGDNGIGMDENTKKRMFEPFFTTKEVGEGTGLGMSIAYNTINKHNGIININSELGKGTDFIIKLPLIQK